MKSLRKEANNTMPLESPTDQKTDKKGLSVAEVKSVEDKLEVSKVEPGCKPGHKRGRHLGGK
jgi:hypothetical protein